MKPFSSHYDRLEKLLYSEFPSSLGLKESLDLSYLLCPLTLHLPKKILETAQDSIRAFYKLSRDPVFRKQALANNPFTFSETENASVLMAYDFHAQASGECRLIEINTNASGFLVSSLLLDQSDRETALASLFSSFQEEALSFPGPIQRLAIVDEQVLSQKMYLEFLMFKDFFNSRSWEAEIVEASDLRWNSTKKKLSTEKGAPFDLVYNRSTDFDFSTPASAALRAAYEARSLCISPHPLEYQLLANKLRLLELSQSLDLKSTGLSELEQKAIEKVLLKTFEVKSFENPDELWSRRKEFFFKPAQSFGGKAVYKGASLSRKAFERILESEGLAQEFFAPGTCELQLEDGSKSDWKYDLRFYVYRDQIQHLAARVYQGQVTNFSQALGGFAKVLF